MTHIPSEQYSIKTKFPTVEAGLTIEMFQVLKGQDLCCASWTMFESECCVVWGHAKDI